jgi:cytochrome c553
MKSPLAIDKETVKKYKIPKEAELHPRQKLAYLEEQLNQLKTMQWRSRVDILHATRLSESDNEVLKDKGLQQRGTHSNEVAQYSGAILMVQKFIDELKAEYPDVGEVKASDNPDGY